MGDSIVFRAGKGAPPGPSGPLTWLGVRGARLSALIPSIRSHLKHMPAPGTIIIHVGTNDLFSTPLKDIRRGIEEGLHTIRHLLPSVRVIWSDILLRLFYYGEAHPGVGQKSVYALNRYAHRLCRRLQGCHAISHTHIINPGQYTVYWRDGLHLSALGNKNFCENLYQGLAFFEGNVEAPLFPPSPDKPS